jgi:hypothetical protein
VTTPSARNDTLANAYLVSAMHRDVEGMLVLLVEVARAGGTRGLVDFVDALGAVARDLVEQLGTARAGGLLTRRLLAAAIQEGNRQPEVERSNTVAIVTTKTLTGKHAELQDRLASLQAQRSGIVEDLGTIETDWQAALKAGADTAPLSERRRQREAELDETDRSAVTVAGWAAEAEAELHRRVPHEALDRDLAAHTAELAAYTEVTDQLDGIHEKSVEALEVAVLDLYGQIATARQRSDQLAGRTHQLQATAAELGRTDQVPGPLDWVRPLEHALRGGPYWFLYLASVQARQPTELVRALADAVTTRMTEQQLKAARSR